MQTMRDVEAITPENQAAWLALRAQDVTSTESAALFGISPYSTEFELWHRKKNKEVVEIEAKGRMLWGQRFESAIAAGVAEDSDLVIRKMVEYLRVGELRMGASFDYSIDHVGPNAPAAYQALFEKYGPGLLEIKNVDGLIFKQKWAQEEDGSLEAPPHIEVQMQHQFAVSRRSWGIIAPMVGGNDPRLILRERDEAIVSAIETKVASFWTSVDIGVEPKPDYARDLPTIARLYNFADPGKILHAEDDAEIATLVRNYKAAGAIEKQGKSDKDAAKAALLMKIGDAEKVLGEGFSISAGLIGPKHVEYDAKGYRDFRIFVKGAK